jgi:hypothetical protein
MIVTRTKHLSRITDEVIFAMQQAKAQDTLYISSPQRISDTCCDVCGHADRELVVVSICTDQAQMTNDPMSGDVYTFGKTCYKTIARRIARA